MCSFLAFLTCHTNRPAWGTPHKPCPHDAAGFERHESADNAEYLIKTEKIPTSDIIEESASLETVGNAVSEWASDSFNF